MSEILSIARRAQLASRKLRIADSQKRSQALLFMADELCQCRSEILQANKLDLEAAANMPQAFLKRLTVDEKVLKYMLDRLTTAADLPDPAGEVLEEKTMPSGLLVRKISVPIGVLAMIYEARPNVTSDAAAAALKSGNAVILKGGSESLRTNKVIAEAMRNAIVNAFGSVSSSSLTTIIGLLVLLMMSFTIGKDIGLVISKGVFFSLVCVFTVMPSLILWFDGLVEKLDKENLKKKFQKRAIAVFEDEAEEATAEVIEEATAEVAEEVVAETTAETMEEVVEEPVKEEAVVAEGGSENV